MNPFIKRLVRLERLNGINHDREDKIGIWLNNLIATFPPDTRSPEEQAESKVRVKRLIDFLLEGNRKRKLVSENE